VDFFARRCACFKRVELGHPPRFFHAVFGGTKGGGLSLHPSTIKITTGGILPPPPPSNNFWFFLSKPPDSCPPRLRLLPLAVLGFFPEVPTTPSNPTNVPPTPGGTRFKRGSHPFPSWKGRPFFWFFETPFADNVGF